MNYKDINEDIELGPETMTLETDIQNIEESVDSRIRDEHIGEKTCLVLETPGGDSTITLNGDYETNLLIIDLLEEALDDKYGTESSPIAFYTKPCDSIQEAEFLGKETKFEPNTVGAMVGLLQKTGQMTDKLEISDISNGEAMMPVSIVKNPDGSTVLGVAKGTPAQDPAIPAEQFIIA